MDAIVRIVRYYTFTDGMENIVKLITLRNQTALHQKSSLCMHPASRLPPVNPEQPNNQQNQ